MGLIPLIDGDILVYEIGYAAETGWKSIKEWKEGDTPLDPPPFDYVAELLNNRIAEICGVLMTTEQPILYLTGKNNFREKIAMKAPYKGNREELHKPWHYKNIIAYMRTKYNTIVVDGMEADDAMCLEQVSRVWYSREIDGEGNQIVHHPTIICTRDKDLRQCPGWHFGWELGNQPQFGPEFVEGFGYIKLSTDNKKLTGVGDKFFYAQLIMGDRVDNIPGIPKCGPKKAYDLLVDTKTSEEAEKAVVEAYRAFYGETWKIEILEQGRLLWMVREIDTNGNPVMWNLINEYDT